MSSLPTHFTLSTGAKMPAIGLGTWKLHQPALGPIVKEALACGYRHIDTAAVYENEAELAPYLERDDLYVTTKLWCTEYADPRGALKASLARLGRPQVDLYLMHWPFALRRTGPLTSQRNEAGQALVDESMDVIKVYHEMQSLVEEGLCKAIGVSNFNLHRMQQLLASQPRIKPAVLQIELHPLLPQSRLVEYCQSHGIVVQAYSPLGSGSTLLNHPVITRVAEGEGMTPAQVCLAWALQRGTVPLPKTGNLERLHENFVTKALSTEAMATLNGISERKRVIPSASWTTTDCFEDD